MHACWFWNGARQSDHAGAARLAVSDILMPQPHLCRSPLDSFQDHGSKALSELRVGQHKSGRASNIFHSKHRRKRKSMLVCRWIERDRMNISGLSLHLQYKKERLHLCCQHTRCASKQFIGELFLHPVTRSAAP